MTQKIINTSVPTTITPITHTPRPQEPTLPLPYQAEEIYFKNTAADVKLTGTLTLPQGQGPFPAVILIAGMGPKDRDASMLGHKPFLVLADHLTKHGIAVLRFDKRGVGKSTGTFNTSITSQDFANDVIAGIECLKTRPDINTKKIGLIGSSEGGMIAPMVATQSSEIAFIVLMAGVIETNAKLAIKQSMAQMRADGASEEFIARDYSLRAQIMPVIMHENNPKIAKELCMEVIKQHLALQPEAHKLEAETIPFAFTQAKSEKMFDMFNSPWYRFFFSYNPVETLKKVTVPVLALNGTLDHIVSCRRSLSLIAKTLKNAGNQNVTTIELPGLNHGFQTCVTGAIKESAIIEETIAPNVLDTIAEWIIKQTA